MTHTCYTSEVYSREVACPEDLITKSRKGYMVATGGKARGKGEIYVRAKAFHEKTNSEGFTDFSIKMIDVCEFSRMKPIMEIAEQYVYRIG